MTTAAAELGAVFVILTITLSPGYVSLTKIKWPLSFATPIPLLPISSIVTIYSSPTLTGFLGAFKPPKRLLFFRMFFFFLGPFNSNSTSKK